MAASSAPDVLQREFLTIRSHLIDLAALLDRVDRGDGPWRDDPRAVQVIQSLQALTAAEPGRAEKLLQIFSLSYDAAWRTTFNL